MSELEKWYNNVHSISISITSCITSNHISINIYLWKRKNDTVLNYVGALARLCGINRPWNKGFTRKKLLNKLWKLGMAISFERVTQLITLDIKRSKFNHYHHFSGRRFLLLLWKWDCGSPNHTSFSPNNNNLNLFTCK